MREGSNSEWRGQQWAPLPIPGLPIPSLPWTFAGLNLHRRPPSRRPHHRCARCHRHDRNVPQRPHSLRRAAVHSGPLGRTRASSAARGVAEEARPARDSLSKTGTPPRLTMAAPLTGRSSKSSRGTRTPHHSASARPPGQTARGLRRCARFPATLPQRRPKRWSSSAPTSIVRPCIPAGQDRRHRTALLPVDRGQDRPLSPTRPRTSFSLSPKD